MQKAQRAKKLENKYSIKHSIIFIILLIIGALSKADDHAKQPAEHKSEESHENLKKNKSTDNDHKSKHSTNEDKESEHGHEKNNDKIDTDSPEFQEKIKGALFDYNEKLFGQALDAFEKILKEYESSLGEEKANEIKIKMAHCYFELNKYYDAVKLLDPILQIDKLSVEFVPGNFIPENVTLQKIIETLKTPITKNTKSLFELFKELNEGEDTTEESLLKNLNNILKTPEKSKKLINHYINTIDWKNPIIKQFPASVNGYELMLQTRLMLEDAYPFNTYLNNPPPLKKSKKSDNHDDHALIKNYNYYEALYWRSRVNIETYYYANARLGFEEVGASLNYKETEKIIDNLFFKSKAKFLLSQFKITIKELEDLHSLYSLNDYYKENYFEETFYILGRSYLELSKFDKAIQKFITVTAGYDNREPRNKLIRQAYYWLGETYYCKGAINDAIKSYEVVLNYGGFAEKEIALYSLGWALFEKGDVASKDLAREKFQTLLKVYPETEFKIKAELKLAEIEIDEGNSERGEKIIQELKNSPEGDNFLAKNINILKQTDFLIGLLYIKKNEFNKALIHLKRSEDTPDLVLKQKIIYHCGICYKALNDLKKSISYFTIASEMTANENTSILAKGSLGDTYFQRKASSSDLDYALKVYDELINQNPNHILNVEWRKKKANVLRLKNLDEEAILTLNKILEEDHENWEVAQLEIGNILMTTNPQRFQAAANHYKEIKDKLRDPIKKDEASLNYGIALLKSNQPLDAIDVLQKIINESKSENIVTDAYQYLAMCFEKEKDIKKAIAYLEESLKKYPNQNNKIHVHKECVKLHQLDQNFDAAIKHLKIVYDETSNVESQSEVLFQLAGYDLKLNQANATKDAIEKLQKIISKFPKSNFATKSAYLLLKIYLSDKNTVEAIKNLNLLNNELHDEELYQSGLILMGDYFYQNNDFVNSSQNYKKVKFQQMPDSNNIEDELKEKIIQKRADSFFQTKQYNDAKNDYMSLIRINRKNILYKIRYAKCCLETNSRLDDAINILEKIPGQDQNAETEKTLEQLREQIKKSTNHR